MNLLEAISKSESFINHEIDCLVKIIFSRLSLELI